MFFPKIAIPVFGGTVVGTIHNPKALAAALRLRPNAVDFLEVRVDAFADAPACAALEKSLPRLKTPLIVTVRHPVEGGAGHLGVAQRRALFGRFLQYASLVDVELRSAEPLRELREEAQSKGIGVILSHHDFRKTPSLAKLLELRAKAKNAGCTVFKVATVANTPHDLAVLLDFLTSRRPTDPALSVMGMGDFGKISRLALGSAGSVLNYGFLDQAQVTGQWPAALLKERLREVAT